MPDNPRALIIIETVKNDNVVAELADICHEHGVPLIVDEAHGAHFAFHEAFPQVR